MNINQIFRQFFFLLIITHFFTISYTTICSGLNERPNILWLSVEDMGPHLGCYGYDNGVTPNIDKLADQGIRFTNAFTVAGVCAPTRSSIITGMYPTTIGSQNMRSGGEGIEKSSVPILDEKIKFFTEYLRHSGYYCTNNYKQDYNFVTPESAWDESSRNAHWKNRPEGKPFFAVFNYIRTHEGTIRINDSTHADLTKRLTEDQKQNYESLKPPPYYPNTKITRKYWGRYLELITAMDYWVSDMIAELEDEGVADNTIIMFWSDHGVGMPRAKRWIYDSGTRVPLIVYIPDKLKSKFDINFKGLNDNLISTIDFAPTVLDLAGVEIPNYYQGKSFLSFDKEKRNYAFSIRDRMDERYEIIRSVRDKQFRYILNFTSFKPYYQIMETAEKSPIMQEIRKVQQNRNAEFPTSLYIGNTKPLAELYDLENDPFEINNLADDEKYNSIKERMHNAVLQKMLETRDLGFIPEPELIELETKFGSRYRIGIQSEYQNTLKLLIDISLIARSPEREDFKYLLKVTSHKDASVRYWGCIGLGNSELMNDEIISKLKMLLNDDSPSVRIAAAEALLKKDFKSDALAALIDEIKSENEWARLMSIIVLDENIDLDESYLPVIQKASEDRENKYVARVANNILRRIEE